MWPVWLFVPNLIGYARVISGVAAFYYAFNPATFSTFVYLYMISYALDAVDGVAARRLGQASKFGAVLDMVTDRVCTAGLLAVLAHFYVHDECNRTYYIWAMILDVGSHWLQMYSSLLTQSASHKSMSDEPWPVRVYYQLPYALFVVCLMNETFLMMQFIESPAVGGNVYPFNTLVGPFPWIPASLSNGLFKSEVRLSQLLSYITFWFFVFKQAVSVIQMLTAARRIVRVDEAHRAAAAAASVTAGAPLPAVVASPVPKKVAAAAAAPGTAAKVRASSPSPARQPKPATPAAAVQEEAPASAAKPAAAAAAAAKRRGRGASKAPAKFSPSPPPVKGRRAAK